MEQYFDEDRFEDGFRDEGCGCGEDRGFDVKDLGDVIRIGKRCFELIEKKCPERPKPCPKPERHCRCGGHKFVEPEMKRTKCFHRKCRHKHHCSCIPCRCECDR